MEDICPSTHIMDVPHVSRTEHQLMLINDGFVNLMTTNGATKNDVKIPEGHISMEISTAFDEGVDIVSILAAMGEEQAISWKEGNNL
jgi:translation initiation factor 5A